MQFTKMNGAGNDFIILDNMDLSISPERLSELAKKLCACHTSIGADGLMAVEPAENGGDFAMRFYNSDGSLSEMCGNGARCIARYGYENGLAGENMSIETTAGPVTAQRLSRRNYKIRLNDPSVLELDWPVRSGGMEYDCSYVELGDPGIPHAVLIYPEFDRVGIESLRRLGMQLRYASAFPRGANINFAKQLSGNRLKVLTFERGVEDFTLACGTGCGSVAAVMCLKGLVKPDNIKLENRGGELSVSLSTDGGTVRSIYLSGYTNLVCRGEILDEDL